MDERQIIQALRDRDPQGITAVYDRYSEELYDYCWWLLRDHGGARDALHDTLLAASVHAKALRDPARLRAWLFALLRAECLRRSPATPCTADAHEPAPDSTELRSLAWKATEAIPSAESDALQLHVRHGIERDDVAAIIGWPAAEVNQLVQRAHEHVGQALRAEMLAAIGPGDCAQIGALLAEPAGEDHHERVDGHARGCATCSERVPRRVSVPRLMGVLPAAVPPAELRQRAIAAHAAPRLLEYRLLAARRLQPLGRDGFPAPGRQRRLAPVRAAAVAAVSGLVAAGLCAGAGLLVTRAAPLADDARGKDEWGQRMTYEPVAQGPTGSLAPAKPGQPTGEGRHGAGERAKPDSVRGVIGGSGLAGPPGVTSALGATTPFVSGYLPPFTGGDGHVGARSAGPGNGGTAGTSPSSRGELRVSTSRLRLGTGGTGHVTLYAEGGAAHWFTRTGMSCVGASPAAGGMDAGGRVRIAVEVDRDAAGCDGSGATTVVFADGGPSVRVSWSAPDSSSPEPTGSGDPTPSTAPDPSPSGSPTSSSDPSPSDSGSASPSSSGSATTGG